MIKLLLLTGGAIIQGTAMSLFLFPHSISSGGAAGVSIIFNYLFQTPYATTLWSLNAGMIILAFRNLGAKTAAGTIYCVSITAATISLIAPFVSKPLSAIAIDLAVGSLIFGLGLGILFRCGASSGGMDILAILISKWRGTTPGRTLFYINTTILLLTGMIVDMKTIIYAICCQWISSRIIDCFQSVPLGKWLPVPVHTPARKNKKNLPDKKNLSAS